MGTKRPPLSTTWL
uniref:Uncharacterized protein n=1 Tax=Arundo donax TaxID=35708 RepID=A0A0A9B1A7_ARUDO